MTKGLPPLSAASILSLHKQRNLTRILRCFPSINMALSFVKTFADCADFDKTVLAYVPQLYDLPQQIFQSATDWRQLQVLYVSTNPLISAFALSLFLAPIFLIVSEVNKNYSQVDRCWSLLPTIYNAHYVLYAHSTGIPSRRLDTLLIVSAIWSVSVSTPA